MPALRSEIPNVHAPDSPAARVAARHRAAVVLRDAPSASARVEYSEGGRITDVELMRMLRPTTGPLVRLAFRRSLVVEPNGVEWEALDERARLVAGRLVLHAAVSETEVVSWAEVVVERLPATAE